MDLATIEFLIPVIGIFLAGVIIFLVFLIPDIYREIHYLQLTVSELEAEVVRLQKKVYHGDKQ